MSDVVELLRSLIRIDTTNPPGAETPAAELLRDYLQAAGVEVRLLAKDPARANVVARLRGGDGPTLAFMGHLDVVPANVERWSVYPFAGELRDGAVWGRGAIDMKCWVAASATAVAELARSRERPPCDIVFIATVDEEVGDSKAGVEWLVSEHADVVRADYSINEGAGERVDVDGKRSYLLAPAEKTGGTAKVKTRGHSGDPSARRRHENALVALAPLIARAATYRPELRLSPETERLLAHFAPGNGSVDDSLARLRTAHPLFELYGEALLSTTLTPTTVEQRNAQNMIPDEASATVAVRALPGTARAEVEAELRAALGDGDYELDDVDTYGGSRSPLDTPLHAAIVEAIAELDEGAAVVPTLGLGFTCSHYMRETFGTVAYGFIPFSGDDPLVVASTKHGPDERVSVRSVEVQVELAKSVARRLGA